MFPDVNDGQAGVVRRGGYLFVFPGYRGPGFGETPHASSVAAAHGMGGAPKRPRPSRQYQNPKMISISSTLLKPKATSSGVSFS
jgi:hypothetical protein